MLRPIYLLLALTFMPMHSHADTTLSDLERWIQLLPQLFQEQTDTGTIYIENYLQCMDDEQALNSQEKPTVGQVIDNALDASGTCTPLLNEMLEELSGQAIESLSQDEKRKILEESL